jgi:hypothetical protein
MCFITKIFQTILVIRFGTAGSLTSIKHGKTMLECQDLYHNLMLMMDQMFQSHMVDSQLTIFSISLF